MASERSNAEDVISPRRAVLAGLDWIELLTLGLYVAMVLFEVAFYHQSEDEGRAWMLARSFGLFRLVFHVLRFEGHPAAYYLLLWGPAHAGMPFLWINWISISIAIVGIYILLRFAPFPLFVRVLLPFGFAFGYQYAVDFRSYALFPVLGFLVAHLYRKQVARPVAMAIVLGLLANLSIHGTMIAVGFAIAYACKLAKSGRSATRRVLPAREAMFGIGIFASSVIFVAVCVWPAKYLKMPLGDMVPKILHRMRGPEARGLEQSGAAMMERDRRESHPQWVEAAFVSPSPQPVARQLPAPAIDHAAEVRQLAFIYPVASWLPLALLFEFLVFIYLLERRQLWLALPFVLLTYFLIAVYVQAWHTGLVWLTLVLILWAAWDSSRPRQWRSLQGAMTVVFALTAALQVPWTAGALRYIRTQSTYPARAVAAYLKSLPSSSKIDGNEVAFSVLPYFPHYIFMDHGDGRFEQHSNSPLPLSVSEFVTEHADVVLLRESDVSQDDAMQLHVAGYIERRRFCGAPYFPHLRSAPVCIATFRKPEASSLRWAEPDEPSRGKVRQCHGMMRDSLSVLKRSKKLSSVGW